MAVVAMLVHVQSFPLNTLLTIWYFSLSENSLNAPIATNIHERITHHSVYHEINSRIQCLIERLRKLRTKDREERGQNKNGRKMKSRKGASKQASLKAINKHKSKQGKQASIKI